MRTAEISKLARALFCNSQRFLNNLFGLRDESFELELRSGVRLRVRPRGDARVGDVDIALEVLVADAYDLQAVPMARCDFLVDVGAHAGFVFIPWIMAARARSGVALEPDDDNYEALQHNLTLNLLPLHLARNVALSRSDGYCTLVRDPTNIGVRRILTTVENPNAIDLTECWSCATLGCAIPEQKVVLMKLDCEGTEVELTQTPGFQRLLERTSCVVLEQHGQRGRDPLYRALAHAGLTPCVLSDALRPGEGYYSVIRGHR